MMIGVRDDDAGDATRIGVDAFDEDIDDVFLRRMSSFAARLRFITARIGRKLVRDSTTMGLKNLNSTRDARGVDCARACVFMRCVFSRVVSLMCVCVIFISRTIRMRRMRCARAVKHKSSRRVGTRLNAPRRWRARALWICRILTVLYRFFVILARSCVLQ